MLAPLIDLYLYQMTEISQKPIKLTCQMQADLENCMQAFALCLFNTHIASMLQKRVCARVCKASFRLEQ